MKNDKRNENAEPESVGETCAYIRDILTELRAMASGHKLDFLAYLLEMGAEEANAQAKQHEDD